MYILPADKKVDITVKGTDRFGNEAPLENVTLSLSDNTYASIVDEAGIKILMPADVIPIEGVTVQVQVTSDARIGEGESILTSVADVKLVPAEAVSANVIFGESVPKQLIYEF